MILKNTVLGSAFAVLGVTNANAADAIVAPEPEAVEYVRVCDAYGADISTFRALKLAYVSMVMFVMT